jgi:hypothetical protein
MRLYLSKQCFQVSLPNSFRRNLYFDSWFACSWLWTCGEQSIMVAGEDGRRGCLPHDSQEAEHKRRKGKGQYTSFQGTPLVAYFF